MKITSKNILFISAFLTTLLFSSCEKWLLSPNPGVQKLEDFFTGGKAAVQVVNATYTPLAWEQGSTYFNEWFIGDVVSDDALKGGQHQADMLAVWDLENFKTKSNNEVLLNLYRANFQGVARANLAISQIPKIDPDESMNQRLKDRLIGEAKFLRALYYFRLVRVFGGVPKIDFVIESSNDWKQPKASKEQIYQFIIEDLLEAEQKLWKKSEYADADLGRATKGAAQAMLLKSYLNTHNFVEAEKWGQKIVNQANEGEYSLVTDYEDIFKLTGENGKESVFEIQYMEDPTSDYGGFGFSRGTMTVIMTRSRSGDLGGGWGFNKPTQNLYNEYEEGDPRREVTIYNPTSSEIENENEEIYFGNRYISKKYAMMNDGAGGGLYILSHPTRAPLNNKVIRYADVLLMYAEACIENDNIGQAKWALEAVRARARKGNSAVLPSFPNYRGYTDTKNNLRNAVRHERRVELAMEGHRWFDITRWGVAKEVMDAYKATETNEVRSQMGQFIQGTHELFPIPEEEMILGGFQ